MKLTCLRLTHALLAMLCLAWSAATWADGRITHLSGPVSILKSDGKTVPATVGARVLSSETVITGEKGYLRMEMTDGAEMVLRPNSQLKIEEYRFDPAKPADDKSSFRMLKGGLRTITGLVGKRDNKDAYEMKTATATIGIRGTQYDLRVCAGGGEDGASNCGALADGTYLAVRFGAIQASNALGSLHIPAGQIAYLPPKAPPVILPRDPGIGFTPPAVIPKLDEKNKVQSQQSAAPAEQAPPGGAQQPGRTTATSSAASQEGNTTPGASTPALPAGQTPFGQPSSTSGPECSIQ